MEYIKMKILDKKTLTILFIGLFGSLNVNAEPSSNVAWTKDVRELIKNADIENGEKLAEKKCAKCHGESGSDPEVLEEEDIPYLHGQIAHANFKQLVDYLDKKRDNRSMYKKIRKLSHQDFADISAYYATQELPVANVDKSKVTEEAIRMATRGDGERFIPPCAGCHGLNGEGAIVDVPALAGQSPTYFITTMTEFQDEDRTNDIYSRMRFIAGQLSEQEIIELANYYASIGRPKEE